MKRSILTAMLVAALLGAVLPVTVMAAVPGNDTFANATVIDPSGLPYSDTASITEATTEGETVPCGSFNSVAQSVWWAITPTTSGTLRVTDSASFYYQVLVMYRQDGSGLAGLVSIACSTWYYGQSGLSATVEAGKTYYLMAGSTFADSGSVNVTVTSILPPSNDNFASATPIGSLPFTDNALDMTAATAETGEPIPGCASSFSGQSAWYVYDAPASGSISTAFGAYSAVLGMYRGTSLADLVQVGCGNWYNTLATIHVDAGSRYYFQLVGTFQPIGANSLQLVVAPSPSAGFYYNPGDPSSFDTIQFSGSQNDPGNAGISSWAWTFGDGSTATTNFPQHQYAADGDYTVHSTVGTPDGRTATETQVIHVRTHDVAITRFSVPTSASAGQTRSISVGLTSRRYAEQVFVTLYKLTPAGAVQIGTSSQLLPARSGNKTTDLTFSYTFTPDDARIGKVSFQATVSLSSARDAIPADNQAQSLPTKVNK
jgi:hypothetical protein